MEELVDDGANILLNDGEKPASRNDESNIILRGKDLLSHLRNCAAEDGRKVSRLGVYQGYGVNILGRRDRNLVLWIFILSLPSLWRYRGFDVVDNIKSAVEQACPNVVSCTDILAITAWDSVVTLTASQAAANTSIPPPTSNLRALISSFSAVGLSTKDMVALSGSFSQNLFRNK
ncbi:hypothetical protein Vadar_011589 [Vaccinium darrowii]|uniref:Uncharacterized protein n=1 Tax=Vaccinium darrowii TaxID=229202 RepID=A0ACB7XPX6_9ERIC|nr:hypothetical protein Vadar_011589 [Vaccinium darrowii]